LSFVIVLVMITVYMMKINASMEFLLSLQMFKVMGDKLENE